MRKTMLLVMLFVAALLFTGCEIILVAPGIQPGTPIEIDNEEGVTETIDPHTAGRYELVVGGEPVRIDVYQETYTPDGGLTVSVADSGNHIKALTASRDYFVDPNKTSEFASSLGVVVGNPPYSINVPADFGKAYVMVHNETDNSITITVKAITRNSIEKAGPVISGPADGVTSIGYGGAILFLGQHDVYEYDGENDGPNANKVSLALPGADYLHLKLRVIGNGGEVVLGPGETVDVYDSYRLEVYSENDAYAGFCENLEGCEDGVDTGEYSLIVSRY